MEENLRTWVWFMSVTMAMTIGPALLGTLLICGFVRGFRQYRGVVAEKIRAVRVPQYGHRSQYSR